MDVLLINPNNYLDRILGSGKIFAKPMLPTGILSLTAYLRSKGIETGFHDSYLHNDTSNDILELIKKHQPKIVGISCLTANAQHVYETGCEIKKRFPEVKVMMGNHHASVFARFFLKQNATDAVVHGEGELTTHELCLAWLEGRDITDIKGLSTIKNGEFITTEPRKFIKDLDALPLPYLDDLDYDAYPHLHGAAAFMPVLSSRGCVNRCKFCAVSDGRRFRSRSPESVVAEMKFYHERFGVTRFGFLDSLFVANNKRVFEICDLIEKELPPVTWGCEGHVRFMTPELAKRMAQAGCDSVAYGVESGNQTILDKIGKENTLEQIRETIEFTTPYMPVIGLFIIGLPGETPETIDQTIRFAQSLPLRQAQFSMFCPYPGTELYNNLLADGTIVVDEDKPEELVKSWERYSSYAIFADEAPEPIYMLPGMTIEKMAYLHKSALRRFYLRPTFFFKHLLPSIFKKQGHMASLTLADIPHFIKSVWNLLIKR